MTKYLETKEEEQVDSGAFGAAEARARDTGVRERRAQAQDLREVVLDGRFVVVELAELAAEPRDEPRRDLLADRDAGAAADIDRGLDLERIETQCAFERRDHRRGEESGRERAGPDDEIALLFGG